MAPPVLTVGPLLLLCWTLTSLQGGRAAPPAQPSPPWEPSGEVGPGGEGGGGLAIARSPAPHCRGALEGLPEPSSGSSRPPLLRSWTKRCPLRPGEAQPHRAMEGSIQGA